MRLEQYKRKRDFGQTPEPSGDGMAAQARLAVAAATAASATPTAGAASGRFVVQRHRARNLHYDFRLEMDGVLASWAVPKGPTLDASVRRGAFHVEDHPLDYYDFEGTIPAGQYGAGDVIVWDWGEYRAEATADPGRSVADGELKFELFGEKLHGRFTIVRTRGEAGKEQWLLIKKRDAAAVPGWDVDAWPRWTARAKAVSPARTQPRPSSTRPWAKVPLARRPARRMPSSSNRSPTAKPPETRMVTGSDWAAPVRGIRTRSQTITLAPSRKTAPSKTAERRAAGVVSPLRGIASSDPRARGYQHRKPRSATDGNGLRP